MSRVLILAQIIAEIAVSVFQDYGRPGATCRALTDYSTNLQLCGHRVLDHFTVPSLSIIRQNYVSFRLIRFLSIPRDEIGYVVNN